MIHKTVGCFFVVAAWLSWQPAGIVRPGVKTKHPRLVEGVKLHPVKPESAKDHEEMSKLYYSIVK